MHSRHGYWRLGWDGGTASGTLRRAVMMQSLFQVEKHGMSLKVRTFISVLLVCSIPTQPGEIRSLLWGCSFCGVEPCNFLACDPTRPHTFPPETCCSDHHDN